MQHATLPIMNIGKRFVRLVSGLSVLLIAACGGSADDASDATSSGEVAASTDQGTRFEFEATFLLSAVQPAELRGSFTLGPYNVIGEAIVTDLSFDLVLKPSGEGGLALDGASFKGSAQPNRTSYVRGASTQEGLKELFLHAQIDVPSNAAHTAFGDSAGHVVFFELRPVCNKQYEGCVLGLLSGFGPDPYRVIPQMRIQARGPFVLHRVD